jgi:hypothetical protein
VLQERCDSLDINSLELIVAHVQEVEKVGSLIARDGSRFGFGFPIVSRIG